MFRVLSDSGLQKLINAKAAILALQIFEAPEGSAYSREMRKRIIVIIDYIINNNGLSLITRSSSIKNDIAFLDDGKSSLLPDIFNSESMSVAKILLDTLRSMDLSIDLTPFAFTIAPKNKVESFFARLKETLVFKMSFYQKMVWHAHQARNFADIIANAEQLYDAIATAETPETLEAAFQRYLKMCPELLDVFESCHYFRLSDAASFVNQDRPFIIQSTDFENNGAQVLLKLLEIEDKINAAIKRFDKTPAAVVYHYCNTAFKPDAMLTMHTNFLELIASFQGAAVFYKQGSHLLLFKSVNPKKVAILDKAIASLTAIKDCQHPLPLKVFNAFKCLTTAVLENAALAKSKDQSLGELSKTLFGFQMEFLQTLLCLNHEYDETLFRAIKNRQKAAEPQFTGSVQMIGKR